MTTCARSGRCSRRRRGRFSARSIGPGEVCQFDLWEPRAEVPVGHGQTRRGWVVVACLGYSRAGAGALIFSKQTPDLLAGIARCLWSLGALPQTLVWDRQAGIHGHGGRPSEEFAAFCGQLRVDWHFCEPADPQAKGVVERLQGFIETQLRARPRVRQRARLPGPARRAGSRARQRRACTRRCAAARSTGSLEERELMAPLPAAAPDTDRRWVLRVPPDPHLRFDTNDYSLDPGLVGRRVEVRVTQTRGHGGRAGHRRARLPAPARASPGTGRSPTSRTPERCSAGARAPAEPAVEIRPLARYDALIA